MVEEMEEVEMALEDKPGKEAAGKEKGAAVATGEGELVARGVAEETECACRHRRSYRAHIPSATSSPQASCHRGSGSRSCRQW